MTIRIGIPIRKAQAGFGRGQTRAHKYWKRVRVMRAGKLAWQYYYNTPKDRQRYIEDQAKKLKGQRDKLKEMEELHKERGDFWRDHPELRAQRRALKEMSTEYLQDLLDWEDKPEFTITPTVREQFHEAIQEADGEPDLHGKPISPYRAVEMAFKRLPPVIQKHFSGAIPKIMLDTQEDSSGWDKDQGGYFKANPGTLGYWVHGALTKEPELHIEYERSFRLGIGKGKHHLGGLAPVGVILHEMAHALHDHMGRFTKGSGKAPIEKSSPDYDGPLWGDWLDFLLGDGAGEPGVTRYAETNELERFAESFTTALMYPHELALAAPKTYNWFRDFLGAEAMRPLRTDEKEVAKLEKELADAEKAKDGPKIIEVKRKLDMSTGLLDMPEDDPRLRWWEANEERPIQQLIRLAPQPDYSSVYKHSDDKFYEMNIGSRTIYMRVGKPSQTRDSGNWTPEVGEFNASGRVVMRSDDIKEIWTEDGTPLDNGTAWWYLYQDRFTDIDPAVTKAIASGKLSGQFLNKHLQYITEHSMRATGKMKGKAWASKKGAVQYDAAMRPVEIDENKFRLRSGTFSYDQWDMAGHREYDQLRSETDPKVRKELLAAFIAKQPGVERDVAGLPILQAANADEMPIPRMKTIRYINDNPDGTKTVIECDRSEEGSSRGHFFIRDPLWRELLTPEGQAIKSAEHMAKLCRDASRKNDKVWVSVLTDADGAFQPHYRHMEISFDGRGQPKIHGDEWRRRLEKDDPRIDDLLQGEGDDPLAETSRPKVTGDKIVARPAPPTKEQKYGETGVPVAGETVIVDVPLEALGRRIPPMPQWDKMPKGDEMPEASPKEPPGKINQQIRDWIDKGMLPKGFRATRAQLLWLKEKFEPRVAHWEKAKLKPVTCVMSHVIPGSKAGEVPPPPGWDRMPPGYPALPDPPDEPKRKLTKKELELRRAGQLPQWYRGTASQREWLKGPFAEAMDEWEETKEEMTAQELPDRYVLIAAAGSGFPGKPIVKYGRDDLMGSMREPLVAKAPERMEKDTLLYIHRELNPVTGKVMAEETRLLLPQDGSVSVFGLSQVHGLDVEFAPPGPLDPGADPFIIRVNMEAFPQVREYLGSLSMTAEAEQRIRSGAEMLRAAAQRQLADDHVIEVEDMDIGRLARGEIDGFGSVGLNPILPNGREFTLAEHQRALLQLAIDNGGRALAGHYMGTGKTVSALALAKIMHAKRDPENPDLRDPDAPSKTLIVAPLNTVEQWREASSDFDEGCTVVGAGATDIPVDEYLENVKAGRDTNDIVVVGPQYFTQNQAKLRQAGFDGIVVDEAHQGVKNEVSQRNAALAEWNPEMKLMLLMTGTPIITSPADILEYVKILSKGEQWAGMTRKKFIETYLEKSPVPEELGLDKKGPQLQIKPEKRAELAAIIAQWTHVAMPKDVRGKTLPAVRIEEHKHAEMIGTQLSLYNFYMGSLTEEDKQRMAGGSSLAEDEQAKIDEDELKRRVQAAKAIANCVAFKPATNEEFITVVREVPDPKAKGKNKVKKERVTFRTFDPDFLMNRPDVPKKLRKKLAGRWPTFEEIGEESAEIYHMMDELQEVLDGVPYTELAGRKITPEQLKRMKDAGWPKPVRNPDNGPVGIICRGSDTPRTDPEYLARVEPAMRFQRRYGHLIMEGMQTIDGKGKTHTETVDPDHALQICMHEFGLDEDTARLYLGTKPNDTKHSKFIDGREYGMPGVMVSEGVKFYSDKKGSLHLLYKPENWDLENNRPREGAPSIMDPGQRDDRKIADLMMIAGNAKAQELAAHIQRFHTTTGDDGPDGPRQMVMFANSILDGCRTMEATLRSMGYRDVNESIAGSPHYDPADTQCGNGKYFVTYIGKTYTGDRELNAEIFKKRKDKLGRDTQESLFVHKTEAGRAWRPWSGAEAHPTVQMSQWLPEHRVKIMKQFKIVCPESFIVVDGEQRYFYGTKQSADILREITLLGNPDKIANPDVAREVRAKISALQTAYTRIAEKEAVARPPLSEHQRTVFNNCEMIVCSDAANVGLNFGNAVESVNYDTLAAPALEWQRITRSARMLPPAVEGRLLGKPVMVEKTKIVRNEDGSIQMGEDGQPVTEVVMGPDGEPVMIEATDDYGNTLRDGTGVVSKLKRLEPEMFQPALRGNVEGIIEDFEILGPAITHHEDGTTTFSHALQAVCAHASEMASVATDPSHVKRWTAIANKAQVAANLGGNAAEAFFDEMAETQVPGSTENLIGFSNLQAPDPTSGTYDIFEGSDQKMRGEAGKRRENLTVTITEASRKLHDTIMNHPEITDEDRRALMDAGYQMTAPASLKIAFGKMVANSATGEREQAVMVNGVLMGEIVTTSKYSDGVYKDTDIVSYDVSLMGPGATDQSFSVAEYGSARAAGAAAKAWAQAHFEAFYADREAPQPPNYMADEHWSTTVDGKGPRRLELKGTNVVVRRMGRGDKQRYEVIDGLTLISKHPTLDAAKRQAIAQARFELPEDVAPVSTIDAASVYMAVRAAEILDYVAQQRDIVAGRMRSRPGGAVVQDSDVTNAIIDSLSPQDRAILKHKKYLVNVRRVGVSGNMPKTVTVREPVENDEGVVTMEDREVFVGFRKEHPVLTEAGVRAMQRARQTSYENLLFDIQNGTPFRTDMDYETTDAEAIANASRSDLKKSLRIGIRWGGRRAA